MTTANLQAFFAAKITLKNTTDYTTLDVWVSSREPFDDIGNVYINLLRQLSGLGQTVGIDLPVVSTGQITILDSLSSLSSERKFSDLLHRYTLTDQLVEVYQSFVDLDNLSLGANLTSIFRGRVREFLSNRDQAVPTLTLSVESVSIEDRFLTKIVDRTGFPNCPDSSVGKNLPIVFGDAVECQAVRMSAEGANPVQFVCATTLGTRHLNRGIENYLFKNSAGEYEPGISAVSTTSVLFSLAPTLSNNVEWSIKQDKVGWALPDFVAGETPFITSGGKMSFKGNYGAGWYTDETTITFELWERNAATLLPEKMVASAEVLKSTYLSQFRSTNYFEIEWCWDVLVPLVHAPGYVLVLGETMEEEDPADDPDAFDDDRVKFAGNSTFWPYYRIGYYHGTKKTTGIWQYRATFSNSRLFQCTPKFQLFCCTILFNNPSGAEVDAEGLGHSWIDITCKAPVTGQVLPEMHKLDMIAEIRGLGDDSSGTVTGTPSFPLTNSYHVLKTLTKTWTGSDWVFNTEDYNPEAFSDTLNVPVDFGIAINGRTEGAQTLQQVLQGILKNSNSKLLAKNDGKMGFYFYGTHRTASFEFTDDNCTVLNFKELNTSSIVNRVQGFFDRKLSTVTARDTAAEGSFKNYAFALDWAHDTNAFTELVSTDSYNVYGTRTLNKKATGFDWLNGDYAEAIARYYMVMYSFPHRIVQVRCPFNEQSHLELMDVGQIQSVELPNFFGTSSNARKPVYNGVEVDINRGRHYIRAHRYRCQIVQKDYDLNFSNAPGIVFTLRLIREDLGDNT